MSDLHLAELRRARDTLHGQKRPAWMKAVVATAIGPKIVDGKFDSTPAIHLVVRKKRPLQDVAARVRIPSEIAGLPTDVQRSAGELFLGPSLTPGDPVMVGYGAPIISRASAEQGTLACVARLDNGSYGLVTAAHAVPASEDVLLRVPQRPLLGKVTAAKDFVLGSELYGGGAAAADERFAVDIAVLEPDPQVELHGGLAGGRSFLVAPNTATLIAGLVGSSALGYGSGTGGWREGKVTGLWPRIVDQDASLEATALCLVQHDPVSVGGDSGSLWLLRRGNDFMALGVHRGLQDDGSNLAVITDLTASLPLLGIAALAGDPF